MRPIPFTDFILCDLMSFERQNRKDLTLEGLNHSQNEAHDHYSESHLREFMVFFYGFQCVLQWKYPLISKAN